MATAPRSRNRCGEGSRLRTEILAAATELLDSTGNVTLRAVARRAGITAPSIYPHFPDRPAIMLAVRRQAFAELTASLRFADDEDPRQRLLAICRTYLEFAQQHPERYRTMFSGLGATARDLGVETTRILTDSLSTCVTTGLCTSKDPAADASALWLGLHGFAHQLTVTRSYPWPADITQRIAIPLAHLTTAD